MEMAVLYLLNQLVVTSDFLECPWIEDSKDTEGLSDQNYWD